MGRGGSHLQPALGERRQEDQGSRVILGYIVNMRPASGRQDPIKKEGKMERKE